MSRRTIQSPGIEIREIDLTTRPAAAVGTSVFIAGFSNQGPTDEVFNVGTFAEFQEIYGKPTNAAERYFYHSAKQVFNSDANVFVSRLPYGASSGTRNHSALVYPVVAANTATITAFDSSNGDLHLNKNTVGIGTTATNGVNIEMIVKDSNDNLTYISKRTSSGSGGYHATQSPSTQTYKLSTTAVTGAAAGTTEFSILTAAGTTLVAGEVWAEDATNFGATPLISGTTGLSSANYYIIGNPTLVDLSETEYNNVKDGNINWTADPDAGKDASFTGDLASNATGAGIIVLNTGGTTTNPDFEGYYAGISDSTHVNPSTPYDVVQKIYTTTSTDDKVPANYTTIPSSRMDFSLSGTTTDEKSNVSKTLESISKYELGPEYVDTINIGLFKVRNTPFSNTEVELTNFLAEGYTGSLNSFRKQQDENGGPQKSIFLENVDNGSPNIKVFVNPNISTNDGDWTAAGGAPKKFVRTIHQSNTNAAIVQGLVADTSSGTSTYSNYSGTQGLFPLGVYSGTTNNTTNKNIGSIPDKLTRVFDIASNVDVFDIDVSIEAGLGTVHALGNGSTFTDTDYVNVGNASTGTGFYTADNNMKGTSTQLTYRDDYRTVFNKFESFARETRKDHIFIADAFRPLVVQGDNQKVLDDKSKNFSKHVYWPLRHQFGVANSNFATTYGNWAKVEDAVAGSQVWIPFSGVAAKIFAQNDATHAPWFAPAGFSRGVVTGVNDIAVSPTQRQRDQLYRIAINPVTQFPGEGIVIFGQKTLQRKPTAFDRINVRRLFLDLEKRTRETLKFFIFEPNTFLTRNKVVNTLTPIFENCKQTEGVYDYLIVCDDRNNPASVIDQNELRVDIYLKPVRAAEFILVNFYAVNTDVNFQEIVGQ